MPDIVLLYNDLVMNSPGGVMTFPSSASIDNSLGLYGQITWVDDTHISVYYDFTADDQLLDFTAISTSGFTRDAENNTLNITDGAAGIDSVSWNRPIKCSRIYATGVVVPDGRADHLNLYCDLSTNWNGTPYNPNPGLAVVGRSNTGFWSINGSTPTNGLIYPDVDETATIEWLVSDGSMYVHYISTSQNINATYTGDISSIRSTDGIIAFGAYETNTIWSTITIEGEISL